MASSSVVMTDSSVPELRNRNDAREQQPKTTRIPPPETSLVDDHFFWTYSEEPHRSRRKAIIKAHPEVERVQLLLLIGFGIGEKADLLPGLGSQTLWSRASDQICGCGRRSNTAHLRVPAAQHVHVLMAICADGLRDRSIGQPEPLYGYP